MDIASLLSDTTFRALLLAGLVWALRISAPLIAAQREASKGNKFREAFWHMVHVVHAEVGNSYQKDVEPMKFAGTWVPEAGKRIADDTAAAALAALPPDIKKVLEQQYGANLEKVVRTEMHKDIANRKMTAKGAKVIKSLPVPDQGGA